MTFKKNNGYHKFNCLFMNMSLKIHTSEGIIFKGNENAKNRKKNPQSCGREARENFKVAMERQYVL